MENVIQALNDQINFEQYSGYIYLSLSLAMDQANYKGYAKWLADHYKEELEHAQMFIDFMHKRDFAPALQDIKVEQFKELSPLEVAKVVLEHEKKVTERIYRIHDVAKENRDYATEIFMHQFIQEQIEEEAVAREIVDLFTLAGDSTSAKMSADHELARRVAGR